MVQFRQRAYAKKEKEHNISAYLNCSPRTKHQKALLSLDYHNKIQGDLMWDLNEGAPLMQAAQVCLDNLGQIRNRSQFINNPLRLNRLQDRLEMLKSIGRIDASDKKEAEELKQKEKELLEEILPAAIAMYKGGYSDKRPFTVNHIKSILLLAFEVIPANGRKSFGSD